MKELWSTFFASLFPACHKSFSSVMLICCATLPWSQPILDLNLYKPWTKFPPLILGVRNFVSTMRKVTKTTFSWFSSCWEFLLPQSFGGRAVNTVHVPLKIVSHFVNRFPEARRVYEFVSKYLSVILYPEAKYLKKKKTVAGLISK